MNRITLITKYKILLLAIINDVYIHKLGRKCKFSPEFYLDYIFRILFYGENWNTFECTECDRSTIRKKFYKWNEMGIFKIAYAKLIEEYNKHRSYKHFFIDSTIIENVNCSEEVSQYRQNRSWNLLRKLQLLFWR